MDHVTQTRLHSLRRFPVLYGLAWAMFIAVLGTLLVSFCAHFGSLSDTTIVVLAYIVHCLAVIFGGMSASRCKRERGWYYGGVTGLIYAIMMVIIGIIVYNTFSLDTSGIFRVLLMSVIGAFSGIIGVNTVRDA